MKGPLTIHNDIKNGRIKLQKEETIQEESLLELNKILKRTLGYKSKDQVNAIKNIKKFYDGREKLSNFIMIILEWYLSQTQCEIMFILNWSGNFVLSSNTKATILAITDTKLYVPVVALSTQDNAKSIATIKSGFKRTINWNKYIFKVSTQTPNPYWDYLINPSFRDL